MRIADANLCKGNTRLPFTVYAERNAADWQELAFRIGWADLRDVFCDPAMHGADWNAVKEKYVQAARNAPSQEVFTSVMRMMMGELDASHLGYIPGESSARELLPLRRRHNWHPYTAHFGARFDRDWEGNGWKVADIVPGSPADRGEKGLLPGDVVVSIDGKTVSPATDPAEVMNVPMPHKFEVVARRGENERTLAFEGVKTGRITGLLRDAEIASRRGKVHAAGNFGYISISAMDFKELNAFLDAIYAEAVGKDGLIVDVRWNGGGSTADRILAVLSGPDHARVLYRGSKEEAYLGGYRDKPLLARIPVVVLINEECASNSEIFAHAIKTLGRGKLVGIETGGKVIATNVAPLLDMGRVRRPHIGWFTMDGRDMENHGAKPDFEVDLSPADIAAGRDPQLDKALEVLRAEIEEAKRKPALPPLRYAPAD